MTVSGDGNLERADPFESPTTRALEVNARRDHEDACGTRTATDRATICSSAS